MIQSEKFYKKYKKRGLDFKLSDDFYYNAIKKCKKQKKNLALQYVMLHLSKTKEI